MDISNDKQRRCAGPPWLRPTTGSVRQQVVRRQDDSWLTMPQDRSVGCRSAVSRRFSRPSESFRTVRTVRNGRSTGGVVSSPEDSVVIPSPPRHGKDGKDHALIVGTVTAEIRHFTMRRESR